MSLFLHLIEAVLATARACALNEDAAKQACKNLEDGLHENGLPTAKIDCLVCNSDGCNGAAQYGPIALLIALPVAIAKIFSL